LHSHFGFGIGYSHKEDQYLIHPSNTRRLEEGMAFHVRITMTKPAAKGKGIYVAIGDTVLIKGDEPVPLTGGIPKKFK